MPSIPHFEDLSAKEIYESLDLRWSASEKLDGSYLEAGLDDEGFFYSRRKGGEKIYSMDDWPDECWASTYRIAHEMAGMLVEALVKEQAIQPGNHIGFEIIHGRQPNVVHYSFDSRYNGMMVITTVSWKPSTEFYSIVEHFEAFYVVPVRQSSDGMTSQVTLEHQEWCIRFNQQISQELIQARLTPSAQKIRKVLDMWFPQASNVEDFTIAEILDINLARKHEKCGDRNWNELRKELKREREQLWEIFRALVLLFKDIAYKVLVDEMPSVVGAGSRKEGVVVLTPGGLFKLVDRPNFAAANLFIHRVKYMLVGGRRPVRPCFLSRTKDWPKEKRLARLTTLLYRYMKHRSRLRFTPDRSGSQQTLYVGYVGDLHQRMLNLFADTRKRIEDGR